MPDIDMMTQFFDLINRRDLDKLADRLADGAEFFFPKTQPLLGKKQIIRFFRILFRRYPVLNFQILRVIPGDETAAIHWTNRGHNRRREPYENEGVTIFEMEGEEIRYISDFFKDTDF